MLSSYRPRTSVLPLLSILILRYKLHKSQPDPRVSSQELDDGVLPKIFDHYEDEPSRAVDEVDSRLAVSLEDIEVMGDVCGVDEACDGARS